MIVLGILLLLAAYLLPDFVAMPYGIIHAFVVIGWIVLVVGVVLLILGLVGHPVGGRRNWY